MLPSFDFKLHGKKMLLTISLKGDALNTEPKNKKKSESEGHSMNLGMSQNTMEKMPPATLVAMTTAMLLDKSSFGVDQGSPMAKELFGCIKQTLWMPDSPTEGMLCSKLDDETRTALANGIRKLIKQEIIMPVDKEIFGDFVQGLKDIMDKQYTLWILPFDKETIADLIDDIGDVNEVAKDASELGSDDVKFYEMIEDYLASIKDKTMEDLAKSVARVQG